MSEKSIQESLKSSRFRTVTLGAILMFGMALTAHAQVPVPPPPGGGFGPLGPEGPGDFMIRFEGLVGFGGKTVAGAPFSAQVNTEHTQKLADGNTIDEKNTSNITRDGMGRTRRELSFPGFGPLAADAQHGHMVSISDPVAKKNYLLDDARKTVRELPMHQRGDVGPRVMEFKPRGKGPGESTSESLPGKTIEGLTVQGTRTTRTIPAGTFGNTNPIVITTERWYSPDLQLTVVETRSDPRFGTTTLQLTNINRSEPDPSLFTVPSGYTVKEGKDFRYGRHGHGGAPPVPPPPQD